MRPIGFIPDMRISSVAPSFMFTGKTEQAVPLPGKDEGYNFDALKWNEGEISVEEATSRLEKKMYPFKEVKGISIHE